MYVSRHLLFCTISTLFNFYPIKMILKHVWVTFTRYDKNPSPKSMPAAPIQIWEIILNQYLFLTLPEGEEKVKRKEQTFGSFVSSLKILVWNFVSFILSCWNYLLSTPAAAAAANIFHPNGGDKTLRATQLLSAREKEEVGEKKRSRKTESWNNEGWKLKGWKNRTRTLKWMKWMEELNEE